MKSERRFTTEESGAYGIDEIGRATGGERECGSV